MEENVKYEIFRDILGLFIQGVPSYLRQSSTANAFA